MLNRQTDFGRLMAVLSKPHRETLKRPENIKTPQKANVYIFFSRPSFRPKHKRLNLVRVIIDFIR